MAKTKIKKDAHGLYVRTDGSIFRPVLSQKSHSQYAVKHDVATVFVEGQDVHARHLTSTTLATVRDEAKTVKEFWYSHGCYLGVKKSDDVFDPVETAVAAPTIPGGTPFKEIVARGRVRPRR